MCGDNKCFRIGLLTATITDPFSSALAKGACAAAEELGCSLFIFPGKYIGLNEYYMSIDARYEYQYNALFDIAADAGLDFIINALGTIAYAVDDDGKREFLARFKDTPSLVLAAETEGYDHLIFDNRTGISDAVDFLADEGRKHICMMVGDPDNHECRLRCEAYREALARRGLEFRERYVHPCPIFGDFAPDIEDLMAAVPEMDAVLCVNDSIAKAVIQTLRTAGKRIGADVAVVGFDDMPFAAEMEPPLASIKADAELLGRRAVEKALNRLRGVPDEGKLVPTCFVPRQSCSILGELFNSPDAVFAGGKENVLHNMREYVAASQTVPEELKKPVLTAFERMINILDEQLLRAGRTAGKPELINALDAADGLFGLGVLPVDMLLKSYSIFDGGYKWALKRCPQENIPTLRKLYEHFYRRISVELIQNHRKMQRDYFDRTHTDNVFIRDTMMFESDESGGYSSIIRRLPDIGAVSGAIYLLEEPQTVHPDEHLNASAPWEAMTYFYGNERFTVPEERRTVTVKQMFGKERLPRGRRITLILADLYSNETQHGVALLEPRNEGFFDELELAAYQLSAAVRTLKLLKTQEEMLAELHSRNLALESLSRIDELTGLRNRRGFYVDAEKLVAASAGETLIICFADMDNLKLVNDRFGHQEGDYALRLLAGCMRNCFGGDAVIGRMGGDEYAAIIRKGNNTIEEIRARKEEFIRITAERDSKPFRVNMSMGLIECTCRDSYDLKDALERADGVLYKEKSRRKKEI